VDDASEWEKPYPGKVEPVTLEELLDFIDDNEDLRMSEEDEVNVQEVLRRMGR